MTPQTKQPHNRMQELVGPNTLQKIFNNDPQQFDQQQQQQQSRFNGNADNTNQMTMDNTMDTNGDMNDNTIQDNNNNNNNNMIGNTMNGNNMNRFPQFSTTTTRRMPFNGQNGQNGGGVGGHRPNQSFQPKPIHQQHRPGPMVQQGGPNSSKTFISLFLFLFD
jgi:hypothetical protein